MEKHLGKGKIGIRLGTVKDMLEGIPETSCVADIGSDHGKLVCTILKEHPGIRCIATDISAPSLKKARELAEREGLSDRISFREGDGLSVLKPGEADAVCFCGMGGELIRNCIESQPDTARSISRIICQPMRGIEELRRYLYTEGFHISEDRMIRENGKWYQVFSTSYTGSRDPMPDGFPEGFDSVGYRAFEKRDSGLREYCLYRIPELKQQMESAAGTAGEKNLREAVDNYTVILERW